MRRIDEIDFMAECLQRFHPIDLIGDDDRPIELANDGIDSAHWVENVDGAERSPVGERGGEKLVVRQRLLDVQHQHPVGVGVAHRPALRGIAQVAIRQRTPLGGELDC